LTDKLPLEIREARINALNRVLVADDQDFPVDISLPGGLIGGRVYPTATAHFDTRESLVSVFDDARLRLIDDGIFIHRRTDQSIQLLERDFANPQAASRARNWLGLQRGWLRTIGAR